MIQVKKKNRQKRRLVLLAGLVTSLVLLIAAYFIIDAVIENMDNGGNNGGDLKFDLIEGESYYLGLPLAYDAITSGQIQLITVKQGANTFTVTRLPQYNNQFVFSYSNAGNEQVYVPPIAYQDSYFDYSSIYAEEAFISGSASMSKLTYVCNAIGVLYYDQRIKLSDDETERGRQLSEFGFDGDSPVISFAYTLYDDNGDPLLDEEGNQKYDTKKITIGGKVITDSAYYFRIEGREDYVYATTTPYFDYALLSLEDFIKARLTSVGIDADSAYAPKLCPDYKQWKNTIYKYLLDKDGNYTYVDSNGNKSDTAWLITNETNMMFGKLDVQYTIDYTAGYYESGDLGLYGGLSDDALDGYRDVYSSDQIVDMESFGDNPRLEYALKTLLGKQVGIYDGKNGNASAFTFTTIDDYYPLSFRDSKTGEELDTLTYEYHIYGIESIFGDNGEVTADGTAVSSVAGAKKLKVAYYYYISGYENQYTHLCHAIIDLTDERIPKDKRDALAAASIGSISGGPLKFTINYTKDGDSTVRENVRLIITDVFRVYNKEGSAIIKKVASDSIVSFRYYYERDGVAISTEETLTIELDKVTDESDSFERAVKSALIGKPLKLDQNIVADEAIQYRQPFASFVSYKVNTIELLTKPELVVAFGFINSYERDPFYAESVFVNKMGEEHKFGIYALNAGACQTVLDLLGGTGSEDTTNALGYVGAQTVATYLDASLMNKYGLFANEIYFVLPRGIYPASYAEDDDRYTSVEYAWYEELHFTIYISDETFDEDGNLCRYASSTLYNTIVKVDAEDFEFLDYSFAELWARRTLMMVDIQNIENIEIDLNMTDLKGHYSVAFNYKYSYKSESTGKVYNNKEDVPEDEEYTESSELILGIAPIGDISTFTSSKFKENFATYTTTKTFGGGIDWVYFNDIYDGGRSAREEISALNMKEFARILYSIDYLGQVSEDEQTQTKADKSVLMSLNFKIKGTVYRYGFDFYRMDDRRVMVSIYRIDTLGNKMNETSYFYISTPAFKKIAGAFNTLINGETLSGDNLYLDK